MRGRIGAGKVAGALVLGGLGVAVLLWLGVWQLQRLTWKQGVLAGIEARIGAAPAPLPAMPDPARDQYLPVRVAGTTTGEEIHLLVSTRATGAGYRLVAAFETETGRRVLLDRGIVPLDAKEAPRPPVALEVTGNLHWPDEAGGAVPEPDAARNIWFARDVPRMAAALGTEPVMVVARSETGQEARPLPVGTDGIPNHHLQYALTWFSLAAIWAGMTALLLWRIRRRTV